VSSPAGSDYYVEAVPPVMTEAQMKALILTVAIAALLYIGPRWAMLFYLPPDP
jgi:hypothetical protein